MTEGIPVDVLEKRAADERRDHGGRDEGLERRSLEGTGGEGEGRAEAPEEIRLA